MTAVTTPTADRLDERLARIALGRVYEPGDHRLSSLAEQLGAVRLVEELRRQRVDKLESELADRLDGVSPRRDLDRAESLGIRFVIPGDPEWPRQIQALAGLPGGRGRPGVPLGLWVRGPLRLDEVERSVAIVGSRSATSYGAECAAEIAAEVAMKGFAVVSGAAYGIDQAAHRGALAVRGPSVAVLAGGVDRPYPPSHESLLAALAAEGAVVSELAPGEHPTKHRFLSRNRLIAALTRGTVVVEAAHRSGALNTAAWAGRLNRVLMGVPGPVTSASSTGVHHLLRNGGAALVTGGAEVLELIGGVGEHLPEAPRMAERRHDRLTSDQQGVLDAFGYGEVTSVDALARDARLGLVATSVALNQLAALGLAERVAGGWRMTPDPALQPALPSDDRSPS